MRLNKTTSIMVSIFICFGAANAFADDVVLGKRVFNKCKACHTATAEQNKIGPHLVNIIGRKAGTVEKYKYSAAMKASKITWTAKNIDKYITNPRTFIPKNKMAFAGVRKPEDRKALIAYLTSLKK